MIDQPRHDAGLVADLVQLAKIRARCRRCGICPISPSTGALVAKAVSNAAPGSRSPGPGTTAKVCGLPVASAAPSAM